MWPNVSRTRASSAATASSASSQDTSWKRSVPVRGLPSRQPSRIAGRAMRSGECTIAGMASSMFEGAGSRANGSQPTMRPCSTSAVKAPQWAREGKRATVMVFRLGDESEDGPFAARTQLGCLLRRRGVRTAFGGWISGEPRSRARAAGCESASRGCGTRTRPCCPAYRRSWQQGWPPRMRRERRCSC